MTFDVLIALRAAENSVGLPPVAQWEVCDQLAGDEVGSLNCAKRRWVAVTAPDVDGHTFELKIV